MEMEFESEGSTNLTLAAFRVFPRSSFQGKIAIEFNKRTWKKCLDGASALPTYNLFLYYYSKKVLQLIFN